MQFFRRRIPQLTQERVECTRSNLSCGTSLLLQILSTPYWLAKAYGAENLLVTSLRRACYCAAIATPVFTRGSDAIGNISPHRPNEQQTTRSRSMLNLRQAFAVPLRHSHSDLLPCGRLTDVYRASKPLPRKECRLRNLLASQTMISRPETEGVQHALQAGPSRAER